MMTASATWRYSGDTKGRIYKKRGARPSRAPLVYGFIFSTRIYVETYVYDDVYVRLLMMSYVFVRIPSVLVRFSFRPSKKFEGRRPAPLSITTIPGGGRRGCHTRGAKWQITVSYYCWIGRNSNLKNINLLVHWHILGN